MGVTRRGMNELYPVTWKTWVVWAVMLVAMAFTVKGCFMTADEFDRALDECCRKNSCTDIAKAFRDCDKP